MKWWNAWMLTLVVLVLLSCNQQSKNDVRTPVKALKGSRKLPTSITIWRYGNFPIDKARNLKRHLESYYPKVVLKDEALLLPESQYNKDRNRYCGAGLFGDLGKHRNGDAVIGLTDYVIYHPNKISPTFGVMGISPVGTYKCVVSSKIPRNGKEHSEENFYKLALHELGHAFGLPHCPNQHCYMVDAEHKMKFPQTTGFCESCKSKLNDMGWTIK